VRYIIVPSLFPFPGSYSLRPYGPVTLRLRPSQDAKVEIRITVVL